MCYYYYAQTHTSQTLCRRLLLNAEQQAWILQTQIITSRFYLDTMFLPARPLKRDVIFFWTIIRPIILWLWCYSVSSGIRPQLGLILSGSVELSLREEPRGWLQWEITTGLHTYVGCGYLGCVVCFIVHQQVTRGIKQQQGGKIEEEAWWNLG